MPINLPSVTSDDMLEEALGLSFFCTVCPSPSHHTHVTLVMSVQHCLSHVLIIISKTLVIMSVQCFLSPVLKITYKTLGICPALSISCTNNHFQNNGYHVCPLLSIPGADNHFQNRYSSMPQCQAIQHRLS